MRMIRSLIVAGIALAAMAIASIIPAVAVTPTDPGIYEAVKASTETPAIIQVHDDHAALTCEAPAATMARAAGRSSIEPSSMNVASTPVAVAAYEHIDPDIRAA
ncbi:hypothetical protein KYK29_10350 [Shinella daejeonensis]|uniref:hypothetical protein n=1 Tax=Shinella daejeonensis TaxID=659017 RepID=UPI0020C79E8E|nr:hypothetical protein [Shinella daejeonensis]MCP8895334.1 hypothetical protein [Shinella daejeonensis]